MTQVIVSPATTADGPELVQAHLRSRRHHAPWVQPFRDEAGFRAWYEHMLDGRSVSLVAREAATREVAGLITISQIVMGRMQSGYLGFHGMAGMGGRGLMTEAVGLAVQHAFNTLGLHRLEANIQPGNSRSVALVMRLGFRQEGFSPDYLFVDGAWRDHERWALLSTEARPVGRAR